MLNAKKMRAPAIWQTDLDTLMAGVSDHYDENTYVSVLIQVLDAHRDDLERIEANTAALIEDKLGPADWHKPQSRWHHYLPSFVTEKTITNNTAALGGNASLLALGDE